MRRIVFVLVGLLLAGYLLTGVTQVRPGERAVVRRFGRVLPHKPEPGLHVGLPWGMDRVDRVPVDRLRRVVVGYQPDADDPGEVTPPGQLLTGDHNLVNVQAVVDYNVRPDRVEEFVIQADRADSLVGRAAETALGEWVAGRTVDKVLLTGKAALPRWLAARTQALLDDYGLGVQVLECGVTHLLPPDEVRRAFDEVTRAQTEIRTRLNEAEQDAERQLREAQAEQYRLEQQAAAYAREQTLLARADAAAFARRLEQYQRLRRENPDFLSGIWWDEMGRLFAKLKEGGRIDLLDNHLGRDGLDITIFPPLPKKR